MSNLVTRLKIYWQIAKFNFARYFMYPSETIAIIFDSIIGFVILIFFWSTFTDSSKSSNSLNSIIAYFMISQAISSLTFARGYKFGRAIQKLIKDGQISNYMTKPVAVIPHIFVSRFIGGYGMSIAISIIYLIGGLILQPPRSLENLIVFTSYFVLALCLSLGLNVILATVQFYTTEAGSIKNVFDHVTRVLSGSLVPLTFFPEGLKQVVSLLPFSAMVYGPTTALTREITSQSYFGLVVGLFWAGVITLLAIFLWQKSVKQYDAVGI